MQFLDQKATIHENTDGLYIERVQAISQEYIDSLKAQRDESKHRREGEFMRVCSVPVAIVEKWKREGFDMMHEPAKAIVARLQLENLDYFITTDKQV